MSLRKHFLGKNAFLVLEYYICKVFPNVQLWLWHPIAYKPMYKVHPTAHTTQVILWKLHRNAETTQKRYVEFTTEVCLHRLGILGER